MPSAVLPSTPIASAVVAPTLAPTADIKQLAADGYFQAIAYWLNQHLVPQNVYAQVLEDEVPGRLKVLIEFERAPQADRLVRFVCDRLYKLNSNVIQGVRLMARSLGAAKLDWEKSVRIPIASERQPQKPPIAKTVIQTDISPLAAPQNVALKAQTPSSRPQTSDPQLVHESAPAQAARSVVRNQFKFFRAALVTGTAAIALVFGGLTELVVAGKLAPVARTPEPVETPWYADASDNSESDFETTVAPLVSADESTEDDSAAAAVSFRLASRFKGKTVEAALETVAVVPHDEVAQPTNPTVTLLFGGELSLNDFVFEEAGDLDRLFSDVSLYEQADVSMIGLAEPLANASTSLQEDFYRRTRPQAVQTLKAGGIDIVSLASEGTMTYGSHGLDETLKTLDRQGIYRVGAGRDEQEAHRPEILEVKGQRIAYLGYNPDGLKGAEPEKAGVAVADGEARQHIIEDIRAIRSQVDWIVVNYRWEDGPNDSASEETLKAEEKAAESAEGGPRITFSEPADWQRSLAHEAVDAGADLVVGYHPQYVQGAEIYRDRAIAYSLGDFIFGQAPLEDRDSAALRVSLRNQQMKVEFLPVTIRDSKLEMATGDRAAAILQGIRSASKDFDQPMRFPAVLKARPNFKLPNSQVEPTDEAYPALDSGESDLDSIETTPRSTRSPNPVMKEPGALFAPDIDDANLDQWGKKRETTEREFEPILEGEIQREKRGDIPEEDFLEDETLEYEAPDPEPAQEENTTELDLMGLEDSDGLEAKPVPLSENVLIEGSSERSEAIPVEEAESSGEENFTEENFTQTDRDSGSGDELMHQNVVNDDLEADSAAPFVDPFLDPDSDSTAAATADSESNADNEAPSPNETVPVGTADSGEPIEPESESWGIQPYAEPLVGPLSALPESSALAEPTQRVIAQPDTTEPNSAEPVTSSLEANSLEADPPGPKVFND